MQTDRHLIRLELPSTFEMLDLVQVLSDRLSSIAGLDEDTTHWVSVAVRESVINAVKHGNREDRSKHVTVEFTLAPRLEPRKFTVEVRTRRCAARTGGPQHRTGRHAGRAGRAGKRR